MLLDGFIDCNGLTSKEGHGALVQSMFDPFAPPHTSLTLSHTSNTKEEILAFIQAHKQQPQESVLLKDLELGRASTEEVKTATPF